MIEVISKIEDVRKTIKAWRREGLSVGLVPTMGYLHEGHESLIERAAAENDRVVVSIFVNPMQFDQSSDLENYPRNLEGDLKRCESKGADLVFNPNGEEMYGKGFTSMVDTLKVSQGLCGGHRPGHFRGVCTVVTKLFNITAPDRAYFGQKDAQQLAVIKRMVEDLNFDIEIVACPIIREEDGLAKSSRNVRLGAEERKAAAIISRALFHGEDMIKAGERDSLSLINEIKAIIETEPLAEIEYVDVVDADSIEEVEKLTGNILVAVAVKIGSTRLIDNFYTQI